MLRAPSGSVPGDLRFEIFVNFSDRPSYISGDSLLEVSPNTFIHTIENLEINTKYAFQVGVYDKNKNIKFEKNDALYGKTFSYETANFNGISEAIPLAGKKGETSVLLKWTPADTGSSTFKLSPSDPIAYEIAYTTSSSGINSFKNNEFSGGGKYTIPSTLAATISYDSQAVVSGLLPGTKYFFRVRAINYGYYLDQKEKSGLNYTYEKNNKIIATETNNISLEYGLSDSSIVAHPSEGFDALRSIDVEWSRGTGGFSEYRLYVKKLCPTCEDITGCNLNIKNCNFIKETICSPFNSVSGEGCLKVDSMMTSATLTNLEQYQEYQVIVAACGGENCSGKTYSREANVFTYPKISQFEGITSIDYARSPAELLSGDVHFKFSNIDTSRGYLDNLNVWCFEDPQNITNSKLVKITESELSPINGNVCDGLKLKTIWPNLNLGFDRYKKDWGNLNTITVTLGGDAYQQDRNYCFGVSPSIDEHGNFSAVNINSDGTITSDARNKMIVRCFQLKRLQPNLDQFVGKNNTCEEGRDSFGQTIPLSLRVSFKEPTGGIFNYYRVFIKNEGIDLFSFEKAKSEGVELIDGSICEDGKYCYVDVPKGTNFYDFKNLIPSKRYATAVLPILKELGETYVSESNSRTGVCQVKIPQVNFNEWMNIISLGPKTDARYETKYNIQPNGSYHVSRKHLEERLDDDLTPIEISDIETVDKNIFDGVFNGSQKDWSKNGIIHLEWKDLIFGKKLIDDVNGVYEDETFFDILYKINNAIFLVPKKDRKFGYRILRSSDLGVNWVDLTRINTQGGLKNQFVQTEENSGLIYPCRFESETANPISVQNCKTRYYHNGLSSYNPRTVSFTDYSVMNVDSVNDVDQARVYLYKVELVFNGITIPLIDDDNIIKIVLPPPNMSFAHRKIINRTMCLDLSTEGNFRELNKNSNGHYSCVYNGIGASGQSTPWYSGDTVYDIGGDLLVDRFELGCNWTRGNVNDWTTNQMPSDLSSYNQTKGCIAKSYEDDSGNTLYDEYPIAKSSSGLLPAIYDDMRIARKGDCIGSWVTKLSKDKSSMPGQYFTFNRFSFPGAFGGPNFTDTNNANDDGHYIQSYFKTDEQIATADEYIVQSEFAAVLYNRADFSANSTPYFGEIVSTNEDLNSSLGPGENFNQVGPTTNDGYLIQINNRSLAQTESKCWINLSYLDNNKSKPRWFSINQLLSSKLLDGLDAFDLQDRSGNALNLGDLTINELKNPTNKMYLGNGANNYQLPNTNSNRYFANLNIMRILTTNAAKAPPISNIGQEEANKLCDKYKVSMVVKPNDEQNNVQLIKMKNKRLPSKKEFIAFSAWPDSFDVENIKKIEDRNFSIIDRRDGAPLTHQVNGCNSDKGVSNIFDSSGATLESDSSKISLYKIEDGEFLTSAIPRRISDGVLGPLSIFFGGSSQEDPSGESNLVDVNIKNYNSEKCVSKFGIQDAVGNLMERTADRIFCNLDDREMWFKGGENTEFSKTNSVLAYRYEMDEGLGSFFEQKRQKSLENLGVVRLDSDPEMNSYRNLLGIKILESANVYPYVPQTQSKMYCNVVGAGHELQSDLNYLEGSEMYSPVLDFFLNIVERILLGPLFQHFNISILNDFRNGDGSFLDFGGDSEVGQSKKSQGLLFQNDLSSIEHGNFLFFNPVSGMPLSCAAGSCESSSDNKLFRIENNDFNLGNSSFQNDGANDVYTARSSRSITFDEPHITGIQSTVDAFYDDIVRSGNSILANTEFVTYNWKVAQSSYFNFSVGGAAKYSNDTTGTALSGRYSFILRGNNSFTQEASKDDTGLRCVVKINEND